MSYTGIDSTGSTTTNDSQERGTSVVDRNSEIEGTFTTTQDLRIEGNLTGTINCDGVLFVADGATVDAAVEAASIIVSGTLRGQIRCRGRLEITATGSVGGEVETAALVIVEGARYEGQITMTSAADGTSSTSSGTTSTGESEEPMDSYSLLRRYSSTPPEGRDDTPASSSDNEPGDQ